MANTYTSLYYHFTFSTKNREPWISQEMESRAWRYIGGIARNFTVSKSSVPDVIEYIRNQREHHRKKTFQEEYLELLKKHDVDYDERYLWG